MLKQTVETPADKTTVRGRVVDTKGEPLIGATVRERGGANGTVTDIDGNFCILISFLKYINRRMLSVTRNRLCSLSPKS